MSTAEDCLGTGFTALALAHLAQARLVPILGALPRTPDGRGVDRETLAVCMSHMVARTRLVDEVCKAELPDFEVLNAFKPFGICPGGLSAGTSRQKPRLVEASS